MRLLSVFCVFFLCTLFASSANAQDSIFRASVKDVLILKEADGAEEYFDNIAAPEGSIAGAAANAELANGMPQNPNRIFAGFQVNF